MLLQQNASDVKTTFVKLKIPVDTYTVKGVLAGQNVKVIAKDKHGNMSTELVRLDSLGKAVALLSFPLVSGTVHIMAGPESASMGEMIKRTIFIVLLLPGVEYMGQETRMNRQIIKLKASKKTQ